MKLCIEAVHILEGKKDCLPRKGLPWGIVAGHTSLVGDSSSDGQVSPSGSPLQMSLRKCNMRQKQNRKA